MGFADFYFEKYPTEYRFIIDKPSSNLGIVITIPCFNEENPIKALDSLYFCLPTGYDVEVIVLINYPENKEADYKIQHEGLYNSLKNWVKTHTQERLKFFILLKKLPAKTAGVGHARKIAMDEALRRFNLINKPDGIIASFDADCTCENNYLVSLGNMFSNYPNATGCSIYFEHPVEGNGYSESIYDAIIQYEIYLRYYIEALRETGYPYAYHCVGSAFAVKAEIYAKQGGMNKRKAGEEFYFLQKVIPLGNYHELNETKIIPSPRESDRVPFGTGKVISKIIQSDGEILMTYNPEAFNCLGSFFLNIEKTFKQPAQKIRLLKKQQHPALIKFLNRHKFDKKIEEINSNCSNFKTFKQRFFRWFNGLMILQFLNESHVSNFKKMTINEAAFNILKNKGIANLTADNSVMLLEKLRQVQRNSEYKTDF